MTGVVRLSVPLEIRAAPEEENNLNHSIRAKRRSHADRSTFSRGLVYLAAVPEGCACELRDMRASTRQVQFYQYICGRVLVQGPSKYPPQMLKSHFYRYICGRVLAACSSYN